MCRWRGNEQIILHRAGDRVRPGGLGAGAHFSPVVAARKPRPPRGLRGLPWRDLARRSESRKPPRRPIHAANANGTMRQPRRAAKGPAAMEAGAAHVMMPRSTEPRGRYRDYF